MQEAGTVGCHVMAMCDGSYGLVIMKLGLQALAAETLHWLPASQLTLGWSLLGHPWSLSQRLAMVLTQAWVSSCAEVLGELPLY